MTLLASVAGRASLFVYIPFLLGAGAVVSATRYNANSPVGMNLAPVTYWSTEQPFINIFKVTSGFDAMIATSSKSTGEEQNLDLDSDGWPITLTARRNSAPQVFTELRAVLRPQLFPTSNGVASTVRYVVRYQGQGTIAYGEAAKQNIGLSSSGRDVLDVTRNQYGGSFFLTIKSTDPHHTGNYIRNIQVLRADQEQALLAGQIFNPRFLEVLRDFRALRFLDWLHANGSKQSNWSERPKITNAIWSTAGGVPYEAIIQLSNTLSADPWLTLPAMADDNYITQLANLVHSSLGPTQKAYIELSNETWNDSFEQSRWISAQGKAMFPGVSGYFQNRTWYGMRTAQMCDIWKSVWATDFNRVVCVLAAQASSVATAIDSLNCTAWTAGAPCSAHNIGAVAIAPYFGYSVPRAWTTQEDGGLKSLFESLYSQNDSTIPAGGWIHWAVDLVSTYQRALIKYKLPLLAYEGGQTFIAFPHGTNADNSNNALTNLYIAANRDPRMELAYQTYLDGWRTTGGQLFIHYSDVGEYSQYGEFAALETITETTDPLNLAPPKWRAIERFIGANPCWWAACEGSLKLN